MKTLEYILPWPPSLNRAWRTVGGRVLLSAAGRSFALKVANALPHGAVEPLTARLAVTYVLHAPMKFGEKRWDVANREKVLSDALTKARVWLDDSQIDEMHILRGVPLPDGRVVVRITEIA